jgi:hypothetical protein
MRYYKYLTEDAVSKALDIPEPEVGKKYPPEKVKRYVQTIDAAISAMTSKEESEANDAVVSDLRDKKSKWKGVKKETKPVKTKLEVPPDQEEEQPPPEGEQPPPEKEPPPEEEEPPPPPPKKKKKKGEEEEPPPNEEIYNLFRKML